MKRAFITGVNRGLGKALLEQLLSQEYQVVCLGRSEPSLTDGQKASVHFIQADFGSESALKSALTSKSSLLKEGFDLVILNAGMLSGIKKLADLPLNEINQVMMVNVWSNKVILDVLMSLNKKPSQVITISSGASLFVNVGWAAYSISKSAVNMLMKAYANEFSQTHFSALAPGLVATDMMGSLLDIKDRQTFSSLNYLHENPKQKPESVAAKILNHLTDFKGRESGSYIDILDYK